MLLFFGWLLLSFFIALLASAKDRSGFGWFLISLLVSPLLAGLGLLILGERKRTQPNANQAAGRTARCPWCDELVRPAAVICKHCGEPTKPQAHRLG